MSDTTTYTYTFTHVPDFDQKRLLLPNTGLQYCVPTASMNWMAYFANHGAPWLDPGPGNWQSAALFNDATAAIELMGALMGTDPFNGTGGDGAHAGLLVWGGFGGYFVTSHYYSGLFYSPRFQDISMRVFNGAYVVPVVGWYTENPSNPAIIQRGGGHALSLTGGARSGSAMEISWRDPGRDEEGTGNPVWLLLQSPFMSESYGIEQRVVMPESGAWFPRSMSKVLGYGSAYIDEFFAFYPAFAVTSSPGFLSFSPSYAINLVGAINEPGVYDSALGTPIIDLIVHADLGSYIYIAEAEQPTAPPQIWQLDPVTGDSTLVDIPLGNPTAVLVGRRRGLYVLDGSDLVCINIDVNPPEEEVRVVPPDPCAAMAYDDEADELVVLSVVGRRILRYPYHLDAEPVDLPIPANVPLAGRGSMTWDRVHECIWVVSDASNSLFQLTTDPFSGQLVAAEISHSQLVEPRAVDVNDAGRVFVSSQGQILEFEETPGRAWTLVADPLYAGVVAGDLLRIAKSHTNYDPDVHGGPAWYHVPPTEFGPSEPDCPGDLDFSDAVDVLDLLQMLAAWGPCEYPGCPEDLNGDDVVDVLDLLTLLAAWGPCS